MNMENARNSSGTMVLAFALAVVVILVAAVSPEGLVAQANPAATAPQMRHFWHVFVAYAIAWILLFGWVFSIFRRLGRVEGRLDRS